MLTTILLTMMNAYFVIKGSGLVKRTGLPRLFHRFKLQVGFPLLWSMVYAYLGFIDPNQQLGRPSLKLTYNLEYRWNRLDEPVVMVRAKTFTE